LARYLANTTGGRELHGRGPRFLSEQNLGKTAYAYWVKP